MTTKNPFWSHALRALRATPGLLAVLAGATLSIGAHAQEPAPERTPEPEIRPLDEPRLGQRFEADPQQQEMVELFGKVERRLREIDRLLSDASAGDTTALSGVGESGIDDLIKLSRANCNKAVEGIDRILELAEAMSCKKPSSSSSSSASCENPGDGPPSPLDKQGQQQTQREQTPDAPPDQASNEPKPGDEKPQPKPGEPGENGEDPKDPRASNDPDPQNQPGNQPPQSDPHAPAIANGLDKWGDLPVHARDVFRTEGGGDLPPRYRDWIDSYYRRLNKRR